jgi:prepilin-type N-terminal cleavage/methylation domain-containing protein
MPSVINNKVIGRRLSRAFTLVELMVVMALASTLAALLLPALASAKEKSRRTVCKSNMRQFFHACFLYANDNDEEKFPSSTDNHGHPQTIYFSDMTYTNMMDYLGGQARVMSCPNIVYGSHTNYNPQIGHGIGYNYLGGLDSSQFGPSADFWVPAKCLSDAQTNTLIADANYWKQAGDKYKIAPHGPNGGVIANSTSFVTSLPGTKSADIGATGGNVALLDGSINWKNIKLMRDYPASSSDDQAYGNW